MFFSDTKAPVMGRLQYQLTFTTKKSLPSSPAIADMLGSCRPKIYALIQLLKIRYGHVVNAINRLYRIATVKLPPEEQVISPKEQ